jgi:3-hydroxyisobutyrate dehydrogenase
MRYGFIGLGNLGGHLAASMVRAGFDLTVHDRDPALAAPLVALGAKAAGNAAELAAEVDAVLTCLPSPAVSEAVLEQVLSTLKPGGDWIEMSTLGRDVILRLSERAAEAGR